MKTLTDITVASVQRFEIKGSLPFDKLRIGIIEK
jgi:hypothetical protein